MQRFHPFIYFGLTLLFTWIVGFILVLCQQRTLLFIILLILGMLIPFFVALGMILYSGDLSIFLTLPSRLFISRDSFVSTLIFFICAGLAYVTSIFLSTLFGQSLQQFQISKHFQHINIVLFINILVPFLASFIEEFGWRLYGIDSLRSFYNLRDTSLWFSFFWGIWHLPLFFIPGFYQNQLWHLGVIHVVNFFIGIVPVSFLMNWMYYKHGANIMVAALCHFSLNFFAQYFQAGAIAKIIVNVIFSVAAIALYYYDRLFFIIP